MTFYIDIKDISQEIKYHLNTTFKLKPKSSQYCEDPEKVECFTVDSESNRVYIPLGKWEEFYEDFPNFVFSEAKSANFKCTKIPFTKATDPKGYRDQNVVLKEAIATLTRHHTIFLALTTGFGKTSMGNMLASYFGLKTVVLCQLDLVNRQWVDEFTNYNNCIIQKVEGANASLNPDADVYIIGIQKCMRMSREDFVNIGTVIIDEAHIATVSAFTKVLPMFTPHYLIALSATPKRVDGMHTLFELYFDNHIIERKEVKNFTVYKVLTGYSPVVDYKYVLGKMVLDWNKVITSIAQIDERDDITLNLVDQNPDDYIMILSDRVEQSERIHTKLVNLGVHTTLIVGTIKKWDTNARVLVAGMKKAGVGFDDPRLTMLIIISDTKHIQQYEGRLRTQNCKIYDIVDNFSTLEKHWEEREKWYRQRGAKFELMDVRNETNTRNSDGASTSKNNKNTIIPFRLGGRR